MDTITVKQFAADNNFISIAPKVRTNTNNYPYITFINDKNVAENVYFSKNAALTVSKDEFVTKELLAVMQVAIVTNAAGEKRTKLVTNSERVSLADMF